MKAAALLLMVPAVAAGILWWNHVPLPEGISRADFREASRRYVERYRRQPERMDVLAMMAEQAAADGRYETAAICFREIPSDHPRYGSAARLQEGQVLVHLSRAKAAEQCLHEYLRLVRSRSNEPREFLRVAYQWLVYLLSVELRFEDRKVLLEEMHELQLASVWESKLLYFPSLLIWNSPEGKHRLAEFLEHDPENRDLLLAKGRYLTTDGRVDEARALLQELQLRDSDDLGVVAARLECHFEENDWEAFAELARSISSFQASEPWLLTRMRGQWALHEQRWTDAVEMFRHVMRHDPTNPWAQMGLAEAYGELDQTDAQQQALERSVIISEIRVDLYNVQANNPASCRRVAEACERIGLEAGAACFLQHARRIEAGSPQPAVATR